MPSQLGVAYALAEQLEIKKTCATQTVARQSMSVCRRSSCPVQATQGGRGSEGKIKKTKVREGTRSRTSVHDSGATLVQIPSERSAKGLQDLHATTAESAKSTAVLIFLAVSPTPCPTQR